MSFLLLHSVGLLSYDCCVTVFHFVSRYMTLSGFKDSVLQLVQFVDHLAAVGLQLESCHSLLLNFILDFYETVTQAH